MERRIINRFTDAMDLQDEPIPGLPLIEITGNCRVLIEHHCGITEYGKEHIAVKVRHGKICVYGCGMRIAGMTKNQIVIKGTIFSVSIMKG